MSKGLEFQFCTDWKSWDEVDTFSLQFNDVTLRPEVAAIVGRDFVECMTVWGEDCKVTFLDDDFEVSLKFTAQLVIDKA
jgi:hypothetical protein